MPDVASVPANVHLTEWFHQPALSAARAGVAPLMLGAVTSYLIAVWPDLAVPGLSRQSPATSPVPVSGPEYVTVSHPAMPDVASLPANVHATEWFHQPARSATRPGVAPVTVGAV